MGNIYNKTSVYSVHSKLASVQAMPPHKKQDPRRGTIYKTISRYKNNKYQKYKKGNLPLKDNNAIICNITCIMQQT